MTVNEAYEAAAGNTLAVQILLAYGGKEVPRIPDGYELSGEFGPVHSLNEGDFVLAIDGAVDPVNAYSYNPERLGLRKKKVQTGYIVRFLGRPPKEGELYCTSDPGTPVKRGPWERECGTVDHSFASCIAVSVEPIYE